MAKKPVQAAPKKSPNKRSSNPARKESNIRNWLPLGIAVLAITAACYLPTLSHDFVNWDDPANLTDNPNLQLVGHGQPWSTTIANIFDLKDGSVIGNYNPLPILTFAIEKALSGGEFNPALTHFTNLLLHLLTVFFVMDLLGIMGIGRWGVVTGGLLFGIHPMRVESVAWASERKDVLFAMFFFWALVYYVKWLKQAEQSERNRGTYLIMLFLALLSCFSKVQAVSLPLSMLALDYWFRRPLQFKLIWEKAPFWLLSLVFGLVNVYTLQVQGSTDDSILHFNFLDKLCIGAYSYCIYLYKLLLPYPMSPLYSYPKQLPWVVYAAPLGVAAVAAGFVWALKKGKRIWVFGLLFFTVNILFLLQIFAAGQGFLADRFTYVAYFGLFAIAAYYLDEYSKNENARMKINASLGIITLVFGVWTIQQESIWKDGNALWTHVMNQSAGEKEHSLLPYFNRGQFLTNHKDYAGALNDYNRALEIDPTNPELLNIRGKTYFTMANEEQYKSQQKALFEKAVTDFTESLSKPRATVKSKSDALTSRGAVYGSVGMHEQGINDITEAIRIFPQNKMAYANRALAYTNTGQYEKALNDYQEYLKLDSGNSTYWYECGMLQRTLNRSIEAIKSLDQALKLDPKLGLAYLERARAKVSLANTTALQDYQKAQQLGTRLGALDIQWIQEETKKK